MLTSGGVIFCLWTERRVADQQHSELVQPAASGISHLALHMFHVCTLGRSQLCDVLTTHQSTLLVVQISRSQIVSTLAEHDAPSPCYRSGFPNLFTISYHLCIPYC